MDIAKLKVPELKRELKNRGLSVSGNKNDLIERLQSALKSSEGIGNESVDDLDEDLLNEDDDDVPLETADSVVSDIDTALSDTSSNKGQKRKSSDNNMLEDENKLTPPPKKVVLNRTILSTDTSTTAANDNKNSEEDEEKANGSSDEKKVVKLSTLTVKERLEMRAKKFDVTNLSADAKKMARAERFGLTNKSPSATNGSNNKIDTSNISTSVDVLKQRAERFGVNTSTTITKLDDMEKLEKRKARFGIVTPEDKAKQRLERFKQPVT